MIFRKGYKRADGSKARTRVYYCRIRCADGTLRELSTGCRDKASAAARAGEFAKEQERIASGIMLPVEIRSAAKSRERIGDAIESFRRDMAARERSAKHVHDTCAILTRAADACGWGMLRDMRRDDAERWIQSLMEGDAEHPGISARTANKIAAALHGFANWNHHRGALSSNPFAGIRKASEKGNKRRIRRALSPDELQRLFEAAASRPLDEALKGNAGRGAKMHKAQADVSPETMDALRWIGRTRALAYKVLAYTGLRYGELRSITIGAVRLDAEPPHLILAAADEKARRGAQIPLQAAIAAELASYLAERKKRLVGACSAFPGAFDDKPLFDGLPQQSLAKMFHRDCAAAGIPRQDAAGRVIDVHALRHTFGTMLARAGVPLQVAQVAMRHSTPTLTANCYTHLGLMDVSGAVNRLETTPAADEKSGAENS